MHKHLISFIQLRSRHYFNIPDLAEKIVGTNPTTRAGTEHPDEQQIRAWELIIYRMLVGKPVKSEDASHVLATLAKLIEKEYTLDELDIKLLENR